MAEPAGGGGATTVPGAGIAAVQLPTRGMLVVGGAVLAISIAAFFRVPLLPSIGVDLGLSVGQLGLITTVFAVGRLATDIPAGRLADRTPALTSLAVAGLVLAVGSAAFASARAAWWVIAAACVLGVASAIANTAGMTYFSSAAPPAQRGTAMAGFSVALLGGQAFGPMAGGLIGGAFGWRAAVLAAAAVGLAVAVTGWLRRTRDDHVVAGASAGTPASDRSSADAASGVQRAVLHAVAFVSFFMLGAMPQTLVPIIGAEEHGLTASSIGLALGLGGACRLVGAIAGGRISDRVSRKASLVPGLLLCAVGVGVFALDVGATGWLVGIALLSLGSYGISVAATMLADHSGGAGVGRQLGAYRFVGDVGLISGPAVSAVVYQQVGSAAAVLVVAGALAGVAVVAALVLDETRWLHDSTHGPHSRG